MTLILVGALGPPGRASGDSANDEARLKARLDPETARAVIELVHSAAESGLPTSPLKGRAFEGASRGADGALIRRAVAQELEALKDARAALGAASDPNELVAGAMALLSGAPHDTLVRLRASRPRQSLVVPLVVLSDLIARDVPVAAASSTVITATRAGARDADLLKLREHVEREVGKGVAPAGATGTGLRMLLKDQGKDAPRPAPSVGRAP